jgi:hypothetical protein
VFAVHGVGMIAFFDGAVAAGAIAFFIGHGTDSLCGGCLRLVGQAVITSVGAAEGCDLLIRIFYWGLGDISVAADMASDGFALISESLIKRRNAGPAKIQKSEPDQKIAAFGSSYGGLHRKIGRLPASEVDKQPCRSCRRLRSFDLALKR